MATAVEENELEVQVVLARLGEPGAGRGLVKVDRMGVAREATRHGASARYIGETLGVTDRTIARYRRDLGISQPHPALTFPSRLERALELFLAGRSTEYVALELGVNLRTAYKYRSVLRDQGRLKVCASPRREAVLRLAKEGRTIRETSRILGISREAVSQHRKALRREGRLERLSEDPQALQDRLDTVVRMTAEGVSQRQIAQVLGVSYTAVNRYQKALRSQGRLISSTKD